MGSRCYRRVDRRRLPSMRSEGYAMMTTCCYPRGCPDEGEARKAAALDLLAERRDRIVLRGRLRSRWLVEPNGRKPP